MSQYTIKGLGINVELTQREFVAGGGQGKVYGKGQVAYKIYDDPTKMMPMGKIQELSVLTNPNIIKPENLILDKKNTIVGYTMRLVHGSALCQLFTKSFKQRNNIDNSKILHLTKCLYDLVDYIHQKKILIVDCNELNFLVSTHFDEVYAIDTDSYNTPSFPATVIMDNIRDRHCHHNNFTEETDWFSWGILAFQLLIGIHPYKGGHPDFANMPLDERMNARMLKNVSAFHANATLPAICNPFDVIPSGLRAWMTAVFEQGKRLVPPKDFDGAVIVVATIKQVAGSHLFEIVEISTLKSDILGYQSHDGNRLTLMDKEVVIGNREFSIPVNDALFVFTPKLNKSLAVYVENNTIKVYDIEGKVFLPFNFNSSDIMQSNGRIYFVNNTNIIEMGFIELNNSVQCVTKIVGRVLDVPGATHVYDGTIIQNMLGRYFVSLFPKSGSHSQIGIKELDGYKIVDAKFENNVLIVIGIQRSGKYDRFVFRFAADYSTYDCRIVSNITYIGLNFTVSEAGICILINEEEKVEIFSNRKDAGSVKVMDDPAISSDMKLCHDGARIMFYKNNKMYNFSMRKP